ncbi:MAG: terminase family protein [Pseudomonadota bacterium]
MSRVRAKAEALAKKKLQRQQRRIDRFFPDELIEVDGEVYHAREAYPKHLAFMAAGARYRERLFCAANRVGKSITGAYETALHLTGQYPEWWEGKRFERPVRVWAAGKTWQKSYEIVQTQLLGPLKGSHASKRLAGTGMVPGDCITGVSWMTGMPTIAEMVEIRHVAGGSSTLSIKAYQQGRGAFEGTEQDVIWLDEEPPIEIYDECLVRTMTRNGVVYLTFTPLDGMTGPVKRFYSDDTEVEALAA